MDPTFKVGDVPLINKIQPSWPNIQNIPEYSNSQNMLNYSSKIPAGAGGIVMKYPWTVYLNYRRTTMVQTTSTKVCPEALNPTSCLFIRFPCVVSFRIRPWFHLLWIIPAKTGQILSFFSEVRTEKYWSVPNERDRMGNIQWPSRASCGPRGGEQVVKTSYLQTFVMMRWFANPNSMAQHLLPCLQGEIIGNNMKQECLSSWFCCQASTAYQTPTLSGKRILNCRSRHLVFVELFRTWHVPIDHILLESILIRYMISLDTRDMLQTRFCSVSCYTKPEV